MERRWKEEVRERERKVKEEGGGSTVNSPIQCSYHLPLSLTTHRRHLRIVPPTLQVRLADVPCLTGKLNRYFTVSYPLRSLPSPRPFLSPRAQAVLSPSISGAALRVRPQNKREGGRWWSVERTERRRGIFLPSNRTSEEQQQQQRQRQHGAAPERAALLPAGTLCASCKYLSAYCITRHDNVRPRLRLSLPPSSLLLFIVTKISLSLSLSRSVSSLSSVFLSSFEQLLLSIHGNNVLIECSWYTREDTMWARRKCLPSSFSAFGRRLSVYLRFLTLVGGDK